MSEDLQEEPVDLLGFTSMHGTVHACMFRASGAACADILKPRRTEGAHLWWRPASPGRRASWPGWCSWGWGCSSPAREPRPQRQWSPSPWPPGSPPEGRGDLRGSKNKPQACDNETVLVIPIHLFPCEFLSVVHLKVPNCWQQFFFLKRFHFFNFKRLAVSGSNPALSHPPRNCQVLQKILRNHCNVFLLLLLLSLLYFYIYNSK